MGEIWKDIPGYEGMYQVSNLGRVKSLPKQWLTALGGKRSHDGIILKPQRKIGGYIIVRLPKDKKYKNFSVHQLVAMAFLNHVPCKQKLVIDHINDIRTDNRLENLQIVTTRENVYKTQGKYSSKYKGVYWNKTSKKWLASIFLDGKNRHIGLFTCELAAGLAYQNKLKEIR